MSLKMNWKNVWYGAYQCGPYIIEKTANPTALRTWYVSGGTSEFKTALRHEGASNGGFFKLTEAKRAVARAHDATRAILG